MLASDTSSHAKHSGYTVLARHVPSAQLLWSRRNEPSNPWQRALVGILSRLAQSRWYRLGSLHVELRAWRMLRSGYKGVVHLLWGDRDWGFLHRVAHRNEAPLCATFHTCPDTLPDVFNHPKNLRLLNGVILMSEVQRPYFESQGVDPDRIHIVHHGVDCSFFRPSKSDSDAPFEVISVGTYRRNFPLLREVCERLMQDRDVRVKIVAHPSQRPLFADLANVDFYSDIQDEQLLALYQSASCLLMTIEAATANNAILEALACGLPIVSEDVGGIREYTGATAASLHSPGDAEGLANSVAALRKNSGLRQSMSSAARTRAMELDWSIVAQNTAAVYQKLVPQMTPPR